MCGMAATRVARQATRLATYDFELTESGDALLVLVVDGVRESVGVVPFQAAIGDSVAGVFGSWTVVTASIPSITPWDEARAILKCIQFPEAMNIMPPVVQVRMCQMS